MKHLLGLLVFSFIFSNSANSQQNEIATKPELRDTLIILFSLDIGKNSFGEEFEYLNKTSLQPYIDSLFELSNKEQANYAISKFKEIVEKNGLPTREEIGIGKAFEATFMLTLHSDDSNFMKKHLLELKTNFAPQTIAIIEDKINSLEGIPQIYGSQVVFSTKEKRLIFYPIINPNEVNQRRAEVGLPSLEKYAKEIGVNWTKEKELLKIE